MPAPKRVRAVRKENMSLYYQDDHVTLYHGDAGKVLTDLPDGSVDCIVTSPPYYGLRDYGVDGQIGAEESPAEFVAALVAVFREARRVLADDGTFWLNLGDSYTAHPGQRKVGDKAGLKQLSKRGSTGSPSRHVEGLPAKSLIGIPWRVAFALQDDGWILRNDIIWHKPNAMPESVTDRLSGRYEHVFMFSKSPRYWFDLDPIREPPLTVGTHKKFERPRNERAKSGNDKMGDGAGGASMGFNPLGKNPGDVWNIPTQPFPGAHFATFPIALPERAILAGCKPGGIVLDPFNGSGTTGAAATKHGRRYVGIDLNSDYLDLSLTTRLSQGVLDFANL